MTFTQLRCFIEVARQLNFARAAETLYISQPAVSRQIHALENELGVRLFDRTRHVVALTSAGSPFTTTPWTCWTGSPLLCSVRRTRRPCSVKSCM